MTCLWCFLVAAVCGQLEMIPHLIGSLEPSFGSFDPSLFHHSLPLGAGHPGLPIGPGEGV